MTIGGYSVYHPAVMASVPDTPEYEARDWHQWYFQIERGRVGLTTHRRELAGQLWSEWSPQWRFDDDTFAATATSFDNPDFVDVVVHSYRVRYGLAPQDPACAALEAVLATRPSIDVPTVVIDPTEDAVMPPLSREKHQKQFSQLIDYRRTTVGHNTPMEDPQSVTAAILDLAAHVMSESRRGPISSSESAGAADA